MIAYDRFYNSNVASGATPIGSAVAHPIESTVQRLKNITKTPGQFTVQGLEDITRTRGQSSLQRKLSLLEDNSHYKDSSTLDRRQLSLLEGNPHQMDSWRTNLVTKDTSRQKDYSINHPRNYDFYMCAHAEIIGTGGEHHHRQSINYA